MRPPPLSAKERELLKKIKSFSQLIHLNTDLFKNET